MKNELFSDGSDGTSPGESGEGEVTKRIEKVTSKIPSGAFLTAGISAMCGAAILRSIGRKHDALFIGQWVTPFLLMGLYNKIVKLEGSE